jgi:hypothetical protein
MLSRLISGTHMGVADGEMLLVGAKRHHLGVVHLAFSQFAYRQSYICDQLIPKLLLETSFTDALRHGEPSLSSACANRMCLCTLHAFPRLN